MNRVLVIAIMLAVTTSTYTACARNPDDGSTNATSQKMGSRPNTQPSINVAQSGTPLITTPSQPGSNGAGQSQASPGSLGNGGAIIGSGGANEGSRLFSEMGCSACHGANGKGVMKGAPDFTSKSWNAAQTESQMTETIQNGHPPMPPYGGRLTDSQIKSLVAYVRTLGG